MRKIFHFIYRYRSSTMLWIHGGRFGRSSWLYRLESVSVVCGGKLFQFVCFLLGRDVVCKVAMQHDDRWKMVPYSTERSQKRLSDTQQVTIASMTRRYLLWIPVGFLYWLPYIAAFLTTFVLRRCNPLLHKRPLWHVRTVLFRAFMYRYSF